MVSSNNMLLSSLGYNSLLTSHLTPQVPIFVGSSFRDLASKWRGVLTNIAYNPYLRNEFAFVDTGLKGISGSPLIEFSVWTTESSSILSLPNTLTYKFFWFNGTWRTSFLVRSSTTASELWLSSNLNTTSILNNYTNVFFNKLTYRPYNHRPLLAFYCKYNLLMGSNDIHTLSSFEQAIGNFCSKLKDRIFISFDSLSARTKFLDKNRLLKYKINFLNFFVFDKNRRTSLWFLNYNFFYFSHLQYLLCDRLVFSVINRFTRLANLTYFGELNSLNRVNYRVVFCDLVFNLNILVFFLIELKINPIYLNYISEVFFFVFKNFTILTLFNIKDKLVFNKITCSLINEFRLDAFIASESKIILKKIIKMISVRQFSVLSLKKWLIFYFLQTLPNKLRVYFKLSGGGKVRDFLTISADFSLKKFSYYADLLESSYFFLTNSNLSYFEGSKVTIDSFINSYSKSFKWRKWRRWGKSHKVSRRFDSLGIPEFRFKKIKRSLFSKIKLPIFKRQFYFLFFWSFNFFNFFLYKKYDRGFSFLSYRLVRFFTVFRKFLGFYNFIFQILQNLIYDNISFKRFGVFFINNLKLYLWRLYFIFSSLIRAFNTFVSRASSIYYNYFEAKCVSMEISSKLTCNLSKLVNLNLNAQVPLVKDDDLVNGGWKFLPISSELAASKRNLLFKNFINGGKNYKKILSTLLLKKFSIVRYFNFLFKLSNNLNKFRGRQFVLNVPAKASPILGFNEIPAYAAIVDLLLIRFYNLTKCYEVVKLFKKSNLTLNLLSRLKFFLSNFFKFLLLKKNLRRNFLKKSTFLKVSNLKLSVFLNNSVKDPDFNMKLGGPTQYRVHRNSFTKIVKKLRYFMLRNTVNRVTSNSKLISSSLNKTTSAFLNLVSKELIKFRDLSEKNSYFDLERVRKFYNNNSFSNYFFNLFKVAGFTDSATSSIVYNFFAQNANYLEKQKQRLFGFSTKLSGLSGDGNFFVTVNKVLSKFNFLVNCSLYGLFVFGSSLTYLNTFNNNVRSKSLYKLSAFDVSLFNNANAYYANKFVVMRKFAVLGSFNKSNLYNNESLLLSGKDDVSVRENSALFSLFLIRMAFMSIYFSKIFSLNTENLPNFNLSNANRFRTLNLFTISSKGLFNKARFAQVNHFTCFLNSPLIFSFNYASHFNLGSVLHKKLFKVLLNNLIRLNSQLNINLFAFCNGYNLPEARITVGSKFKRFVKWVLARARNSVFLAVNVVKTGDYKYKMVLNNILYNNTANFFSDYYLSTDFSVYFLKFMAVNSSFFVTELLNNYILPLLASFGCAAQNYYLQGLPFLLARQTVGVFLKFDSLSSVTNYFFWGSFFYEKKLFYSRFFSYFSLWLKFITYRLKNLNFKEIAHSVIRERLISFFYRLTKNSSGLYGDLSGLSILPSVCFIKRCHNYNFFLFKRFLELDPRTNLTILDEDLKADRVWLKNSYSLKFSKVLENFKVSYKFFSLLNANFIPYYLLNRTGGGLVSARNNCSNSTVGATSKTRSFGWFGTDENGKFLNTFYSLTYFKEATSSSLSNFKSFFRTSISVFFWLLSYNAWSKTRIFTEFNRLLRINLTGHVVRKKLWNTRFTSKRGGYNPYKRKITDFALSKFFRKIKRSIKKQFPKRAFLLKFIVSENLKLLSFITSISTNSIYVSALNTVILNLAGNYSFFKYLLIRKIKCKFVNTFNCLKGNIVSSEFFSEQVYQKSMVNYCRNVLNYSAFTINLKRTRAYSENRFSFKVRTSFYAKVRQLSKLRVFTLVKKIGLVAKDRRLNDFSFHNRKNLNFETGISSRIFKSSGYFIADSPINQEVNDFNHKFINLRLGTLLLRRKKFFSRIFRKKLIYSLFRVKFRFVRQLYAIFKRKRRLKTRIRVKLMSIIFKAVLLLYKFSASRVLNFFNISALLTDSFKFMKSVFVPTNSIVRLSTGLLQFKYLTGLYNKFCYYKNKLKLNFYFNRKFNFIAFIIISFFKKISVFFNNFLFALSSSNNASFFPVFCYKWVLFFLNFFLVRKNTYNKNKLNFYRNVPTFVYHKLSDVFVDTSFFSVTKGANVLCSFVNKGEYLLSFSVLKYFAYNSNLLYSVSYFYFHNFVDSFKNINGLVVTKKLIFTNKSNNPIWKFFLIRSIDFSRQMSSNTRLFVSLSTHKKKRKFFNSKWKRRSVFSSRSVVPSFNLKHPSSRLTNFFYANKLKAYNRYKRMFGFLAPVSSVSSHSNLKSVKNFKFLKRKKNLISFAILR